MFLLVKKYYGMTIAVVLFALIVTSCSGGGNGGTTTTPSETGTEQSGSWSDPVTWGGSLPEAGAAVTIPVGRTVVLDIDTPPLTGLTIHGSLIFANQDINLTSDWVMVHGALRIGSETIPYTDKAVITLTGDNPAENSTTRGIMVSGGELELHGNAPETIHSKIDGHVQAGDSQINLLEANGWNEGDQIILAPTDYYGIAETEQFTLAAINGTELTLTDPVQNARWGLLQYVTSTGMALTPDGSVLAPAPIIEGDTPLQLDERAEVANLTRNIVIQGVDDALWQNDGFGAHLMIMDGINSVVHIDGVEFRRSGQAGVLARYPVHWHHASYDTSGNTLGDVNNHYLRNSSIHNSGNRCITIHATNGVQVQNNICFDILGHAIFFEDAVERRNVVENNVVMKVRNPTAGNALKLHDTNAEAFDNGSSGIWATNPDNTVRNNVLVDAQGFGLWMAFQNEPTGSSALVSMRPNRLRFGNFDGNTMHSNRSRGAMFDRFAINDAGNTTEGQYFSTSDEGANTTYPFDNLRPFTIKGWKLWKNQGSGNFWNRVFWPAYEEFISADSEGKFFSGSGSRGIIRRSLLIGTSLNNANDARSYPATAFATYHSAFDMRENVVVNFPAAAGLTSGVFASDDYYIRAIEKGHIRNPNNLFINSDPGFRSDAATDESMPFNFAQGFTTYVFSGAIWDPNGIWGVAGNWNVYNIPFLTHGANCTVFQNSGPGNHPGAASCDGTYYGIDQFVLDKGNAPADDSMAIHVTRFDDNNPDVVIDTWQVDGAAQGLALWHMRHFAAQPNGIYLLDFPGSTVPSDLATTIENMFGSTDTFVLGIRFSSSVEARVFISTYDYANYIQDGHAAANNGNSWPSKHNYEMVDSRQEVIDSSGETYWQDSDNNIVWIKVGLTHATLGDLVQIDSNPLGVDGVPVGSNDVYYLYNQTHLRIWSCGVTPPAPCN